MRRPNAAAARASPRTKATAERGRAGLRPAPAEGPRHRLRADAPRRFAAAPGSGAPSTRPGILIGSADPWSADCFRQRPAALADHGPALPLFSFFIRGGRPRNLSGRRAVLGGMFPPTARCARRPWVGATVFLIRGGRPRNLSRAGRWGWAGALSAMDGAKRGMQARGCCRPPTSPTARPTHGSSSKVSREGVSHVRRRRCQRPGTPTALNQHRHPPQHQPRRCSCRAYVAG